MVRRLQPGLGGVRRRLCRGQRVIVDRAYVATFEVLEECAAQLPQMLGK